MKMFFVLSPESIAGYETLFAGARVGKAAPFSCFHHGNDVITLIIFPILAPLLPQVLARQAQRTVLSIGRQSIKQWLTAFTIW